MKNLLTFTLAATLALPLCAQETEASQTQNEDKSKASMAVRPEVPVWPAYIAVSQWPRAIDVVGLRLTIPFSTSQESVTGIDLGFWGKSLYFEGIQLNLLRNDVTDGGAGVQVGLYNSVGRDEILGFQVGLWNEAQSLSGIQAGLVNVVGSATGFQIGLVNRAETLHGYQVGLVNVIRDAEIRFFPLVNVGF